MEKVTNGFDLLMKDTDGVGQALMDAIFKMSETSALDKKHMNWHANRWNSNCRRTTIFD